MKTNQGATKNTKDNQPDSWIDWLGLFVISAIIGYTLTSLFIIQA